jgi:hypothetical protein
VDLTQSRVIINSLTRQELRFKVTQKQQRSLNTLLRLKDKVHLEVNRLNYIR